MLSDYLGDEMRSREYFFCALNGLKPELTSFAKFAKKVSDSEVSPRTSNEIHFESTACAVRWGQTVRLAVIRACMAPVLYPSSGDQTV